MCDDQTERENQAWLKKRAMTRRSMGVMGLGAGVMAMLPGCASPGEAGAGVVEVVETSVEITTPDGVCNAHFAHPASGAHAAVLVWPDIMGLRPAFEQMGKRLAGAGYAVLTVNPYYRMTPGPVIQPGESFSDGPVRERIIPFARALSIETNVTDAKAFTAWLDEQDAVDTARGIGTTGYCMGGPMVFRTAAAVPDRIGAAATFHGGGLATDTDKSPHLLIPQMKAGFLIAVAENDDEKDPDAKVTLKDTFGANGLSAEIEVYDDAMHGWCPPDSRVYNEVQAERAWSRLLALFERNLA